MQVTNTTFYKLNFHFQAKHFGRNLQAALFVLLIVVLPVGVFAQDATWFTDVTSQVGLYTTNIGAAIAVDVNNDDYPDLITIGPTSDSALQLWINEERPGSFDPTDRIFVNETKGSGLDVAGVLVGLGGAADFNNDGNVDLIVNTWYFDSSYNFNASDPMCPPNPDSGGNRVRIFLGDGQGHFTLKSNSGLEAIGPNSGTAINMLDFNRDGNLDLYIGCLYQNWCFQRPFGSHLMQGNGDGTFTDVTESSGIQSSQKDPSNPPYDPSVTPPAKRAYFGANVSDWNNDCWPDIFACPYEAIGYPFEVLNGESYPTNADTLEDTKGYGNLYKNNSGDGTFTDVGVTANWDPHFAWADQGMVPWAAMPGDYNNDGNMDYLVILVHGANNPVSAPYNAPNAFPGDGRTCIFTNLGPGSGFKLNPDVSQITRSNPQNITHGDHNGFWTDFNNDGWQDLVIGDAAYDESQYGYPDDQRMFFELQDPSTNTFSDITRQLGFITGSIIEHKIRRPSVILPVDFDMDGDDDIIKCPYNPPGDSMLILKNNIGNTNNHITVKLVAPKGVNKSCIGARITVKAGGIKQMKDIYGNQGSQTNQYPFIQNFGIGTAASIDSIDVRWPDANCTHTIITNPPINKTIVIDSNSYVINAVKTPTVVKTSVELYPNPTSASTINLKMNYQYKATVEIYNSIGALVGTYNVANTSFFQIPVGNLQEGIYWVRVISSTGDEATKSFVKTSVQ